MKRQPGIVALVNRTLKANGRPERLARGRGYYYVRNTNARSTILSSYFIAADRHAQTIREIETLINEKITAVSHE